MSDIIDRVARAICKTNIYDASCVTLTDPERSPCTADNCAAVTAARAALAEIEKDGFQIARPHDWKPQKGWPYKDRALVLCQRCGANRDGLAVPYSCGTL